MGRFLRIAGRIAIAHALILAVPANGLSQTYDASLEGLRSLDIIL